MDGIKSDIENSRNAVQEYNEYLQYLAEKYDVNFNEIDDYLFTVFHIKLIYNITCRGDVHHLETFRQFISTIGVQLFATEVINVYVHIPSFATVEHFRKEQNIASH